MLKAIKSFQTHLNFFKCWLTLGHFALEHPVVQRGAVQGMDSRVVKGCKSYCVIFAEE